MTDNSETVYFDEMDYNQYVETLKDMDVEKENLESDLRTLARERHNIEKLGYRYVSEELVPGVPEFVIDICKMIHTGEMSKVFEHGQGYNGHPALLPKIRAFINDKISEEDYGRLSINREKSLMIAFGEALWSVDLEAFVEGHTKFHNEYYHDFVFQVFVQLPNGHIILDNAAIIFQKTRLSGHEKVKFFLLEKAVESLFKKNNVITEK